MDTLGQETNPRTHVLPIGKDMAAHSRNTAGRGCVNRKNGAPPLYTLNASMFMITSSSLDPSSHASAPQERVSTVVRVLPERRSERTVQLQRVRQRSSGVFGKFVSRRKVRVVVPQQVRHFVILACARQVRLTR